jgi:Family of unknown function (DUF6152)
MNRTVALLLMGVVLAGGRLLAHHSFAAAYDPERRIEIEGVMTELVWRNPHSFMKIDVTEKDGTTKSWTLEWGSITQLSLGQITRTSLKPGDRLIVTGQPARDAASPRVLIQALKRPSDGWEWKGKVD